MSFWGYQNCPSTFPSLSTRPRKTTKKNKNTQILILKKQFSNNLSSNSVKVPLIKALNHWLLQQIGLGIH